VPISTPAQPVAVVGTNTSATTVTTASFTPTGSSLLLAVTHNRWSDGSGPTNITSVASTFTTGGWTAAVGNIATDNVDEYGTRDVRTTIWWAIADASPGAGTITATWGDAFSQNKELRIIEIDSGFDSTTPIAQFKAGGTASTVSSLTDDFATAPATTSMLISGASASGTATTTTADTGWTLTSSSSSFSMSKSASYRTGTTSTQFGASFGASQADGVAIVAIEIQEPAAGGGASKLIGGSLIK
jgi:hypothetical protein